MAEHYDPPEEKIAELVARHTPRQLAIAYLRATRRARQSETAFKILTDLDAAHEALQRGDAAATIKALERVHKTTKTMSQTDEVQK